MEYHATLEEWAYFFDEERLKLTLSYLREFYSKFQVIPRPCYVFRMFKMMRPEAVRVVMVGQSPYPGVCPATHVEYAFGPAFYPNPRCATTPATLRLIMAELCRDLGRASIPVPPIQLLNNWVKQGVMLLNASLTLGGPQAPKYLEDHSVLWEEVMRNLLNKMSRQSSKAAPLGPVFVLIGKSAWKLEDCLRGPPPIRVLHPVARSHSTGSTNWMGSSVFSAISKAMIERGMMPVKWLPS